MEKIPVKLTSLSITLKFSNLHSRVSITIVNLCKNVTKQQSCAFRPMLLVSALYSLKGWNLVLKVVNLGR